MKKILKKIWTLVYRIFVNPCHGCKREGCCDLYYRGYCGDWGLSYYEEKTDTKEGE